MRIGKLLIVGLLVCTLFLTSCGNEISTDEFQVNSTENVVESDNVLNSEDHKQEAIGILSHGANWSEEEENYSFSYYGGQLEIPYKMNGNGICTSVGFLLYLDGVPQPYTIKGGDEKYKYMHVIEGKENTDTEFVFSFVPVTGKAGDTVQLSINSISSPSFIPDMVSTFDYGMYHQSIEAVYDITFHQNAEDALVDADELCMMSNVSNQQTDIDKKEKKYIQEQSLEPKLDLDTSVYRDLIIDHHSMLIDRKLDIADKNIVHVSYIMMGHPGVEYKINFYFNHHLLLDKSKKINTIALATGKMNTIEFDLDLSKITDGTFYAVAIPVNADDYPEDAIQTEKYPSIHLYKGAK